MSVHQFLFRLNIHVSKNLLIFKYSNTNLIIFTFELKPFATVSLNNLNETEFESTECSPSYQCKLSLKSSLAINSAATESSKKRTREYTVRETKRERERASVSERRLQHGLSNSFEARVMRNFD